MISGLSNPSKIMTRFEIISGKVYNICQNKECNKRFIPEKNWNRVQYCCPKCLRTSNYKKIKCEKRAENRIEKILNTRTP